MAILTDVLEVVKCYLLGLHEWGPWLPATDEWKCRRYCTLCPEAEYVDDPKRVCCCGSLNPGSHKLRCEKCGKQFCWGILYGVECPHCGYCAEEEDNVVDQSV